MNHSELHHLLNTKVNTTTAVSERLCVGHPLILRDRFTCNSFTKLPDWVTEPKAHIEEIGIDGNLQSGGFKTDTQHAFSSHMVKKHHTSLGGHFLKSKQWLLVWKKSLIPKSFCYNFQKCQFSRSAASVVSHWRHFLYSAASGTGLLRQH